MSWNEVRLSDLGDVVTGKTPSTKIREFFDGVYLFVTPSDLNYGHYYCSNTETTVTESAKNKLKNQFIPKDSVMFTCIGNTIGKCAISSAECLTNQQINSIVANENNNPKFIYYLLNHKIEYIRGIGLGGGSATPIINKTTFSNLKFKVPDLPTQERIAEVLSAYDDLIENNRRRIRLLEESARLLYREWFVHFRFPGHEHIPRTPSGLPDGWEIKKLGTLLQKINRPQKIKKEDYLPEGLIPCVDQSRDFIGGYTDDIEAEINSPLPLVVFGDHTRIIKFIDFPFACGADGTQLLYPNDENITIQYFYYAVDNIDLSNYFYARHFKFLKDQEVTIPPQKLMQNFTEFTKDSLNQIKFLKEQNQKLAAARDILLPRLMNGEVAV